MKHPWPETTVCDTCGSVGTTTSKTGGRPPYKVEYDNGSTWVWRFKDDPMWCPPCVELKRQEIIRQTQSQFGHTLPVRGTSHEREPV